jgi:hypothetical protein
LALSPQSRTSPAEWRLKQVNEMTELILKVLRVLSRKLFYLEDWNIGIIQLPTGGVRELIGWKSVGTVDWRASTNRRSFVADPSIWPHPSSPRVLVEEFDYWIGRGRIRSVSLDGLLLPALLKDEIKIPYHASYPFVFCSDNSWYCIPECSESDAVDLYVWNAGINRWEFDSRLLQEIRVLDPTPFTQNGIWYLFGTMAEDGPTSKLRIWLSRALRGPWQIHPMNPARSAPDQVRPAGPIFCVDGNLYRPSQDCRGEYGSGIILNRIECLSPFSFMETPVQQWRPQKASIYSHGMHTICFTATTAIIDGKRFIFSPWAVAWKFWWKIMRLVRRARQVRVADDLSSGSRHNPSESMDRIDLRKGSRNRAIGRDE